MDSADNDLKAHATSHHDFYSLLDLTPAFVEADLNRAWRKTARKYHPDKVGAANIEAREKFLLSNIAYQILSDPSLRKLYDDARDAREQRRKREQSLHEERRRKVESLKQRERAAAFTTFGGTSTGLKRARDEEQDEQERREREIQRIAEDGRRRRLDREEKLRSDMKEQEDALNRAKNKETQEPAIEKTQEQQGVADLDRSIKVKFARPSQAGDSFDAPAIQNLFSTFGSIENVAILGDKRQRRVASKAKTTIGRALIVFKSILGAHSAVKDWEELAKNSGAWDAFEDVFWASGKEPDWLENNTTPSRVRVAPAPAAGGLSLEEATLLRLRKHAEERRLKAEKLAEQQNGQDIQLA